MKKRPTYIRLQICRIAVLLLYSLFFTVQVFFNFDPPRTRTHVFNNNITSQDKALQVASRPVHAGKQKETRTKIRLNKRFHPSVAPAVAPFSIAAPVFFVQRRTATGYRNPFYNSIELLTHSLRGPPAPVYHFV